MATSLSALILKSEEELQDVKADDESPQVQEQAAEEKQPENCLSKQTGQTEPVDSLDVIDYLSKDVFYIN